MDDRTPTGLTYAEHIRSVHRAILRAVDAKETSILEIAKEFGLSDRQVYRVIAARRRKEQALP